MVMRSARLADFTTDASPVPDTLPYLCRCTPEGFWNKRTGAHRLPCAARPQLV